MFLVVAVASGFLLGCLSHFHGCCCGVRFSSRLPDSCSWLLVWRPVSFSAARLMFMVVGVASGFLLGCLSHVHG
jgi:hypothetical protein